jgi:Ca2+-binding RTX toxin-like protein
MNATSNAAVLGGRSMRWLIVGTLALASAVAALAVPATASADGPLECNGRQPTVLAVPGVRTFGTPASDVIIGFILTRDTIGAGDGNDLVCGLDRGDSLSGWTGGDHLRGNDGPDALRGSAHGDQLRGGDGNDRMLGGSGFDRCFGGPGSDVAIGCEAVTSADVR